MSAELWASLDEVIERVIAGVVRRTRLPAGDRDDFRQDARLFYLRRLPRIRTAFQGRSALDTYVYTAVWRLFLTRQRRAGTSRSARTVSPSTGDGTRTGSGSIDTSSYLR